ncbi:hypothetical protein PsorP6_012115 [Peronosclerospora sorghi]|uniref:Uncharacterized protein n=1 Tax=Peronosclerospora sorghi TaxID=230839 RepID=A0ACC0WIH6_9STRA|nr:hypothetical protein PsorP6_012115 [Peronosclerospora sorghi]
MGYLAAALGSWAWCSLERILVRNLYFVHDAALGLVSLSFIVLLAALYVPATTSATTSSRSANALHHHGTAALAQCLDHEGEVKSTFKMLLRLSLSE